MLHQPNPGKDPDFVFNLFKYFLDKYPTREYPFAICKPDTLTHWVKKWMVDAGVGQFYLHCTRHSFVTFLLEQGYSARQVQRLVGHRQLSTTMRYVHEVSFPDSIDINI